MGFRDMIRMTAKEFEVLLRRVAPPITKRDTKIRLAITVKERIAVTLRFLATGLRSKLHSVSLFQSGHIG